MTRVQIVQNEEGRWQIRWYGTEGVAESGVTYKTALEAREQVLNCAPKSAVEGTLMIEYSPPLTDENEEEIRGERDASD